MRRFTDSSIHTCLVDPLSTQLRLVASVLVLGIALVVGIADGSPSGRRAHAIGRAGFVSDGEFALFGSDGRVVVAQDGAGSTHIWNTKSGSKVAALGDNLGAAVSPDGSRVVTVGAGPAAVNRLWDARTGRALRRLVPPDGAGAWSASFSPDGRLVAT